MKTPEPTRSEPCARRALASAALTGAFLMFVALPAPSVVAQSDTDAGWLFDFAESDVYFTNRNVFDTDGDDLTDAQESQYNTVLNDADTDHDGVSDGDEVLVYGTNPLAWDTDGNGYSDREDILTATMGGATPAGPSEPDINEPVEPMEPAVTEAEREKILTSGSGGGAGGGATGGGDGGPCAIEGACDDRETHEPFREDRPSQG